MTPVLTFVWHVFLVVWFTSVGTGFTVVVHRRGAKMRKLKESIEQQILKTRHAELQARERRALER